MALIPWWISYPNVNDEIMNLDWLLRVSNENTDKISNFINLNTIKYADPILWDITSQYEANTITVDPQTGDAYISTKAVPYGVSLSNTDYWTKIYNYADEINNLEEQIAIANERLSTTASASRVIGDLVWLNGLLYRVTAPMIAGDSYVVDSNCVKTTIEDELDDEAQARAEADTALGGRITSEAEARAAADTALGGRITSEAEARTAADTALGGRITSEAEARTAADAQLQNNINALNLKSTFNYNKRNIICIGDSYGQFNSSIISWISYLNDYMYNKGEFYHMELGGAGFLANLYSPDGTRKSFQDLIEMLEGDIENPNNITDVIVCGGYNDLSAGHEYISQLQSKMEAFKSYVNQHYPNARIYVGMIGRSTDLHICKQLITETYLYYSNACHNLGLIYLSGVETCIKSDNHMRDNIHPNNTGAVNIGESILQIINGANKVYAPVITGSSISSDDSTVNSLVTLYQITDGIELKFSEGTKNYNSVQEITYNQANVITIGTIDNQFGHVFEYNLGCTVTVKVVDTDYNFINATGYLFVEDRTVKLKISLLANNNWATINTRRLIIENATIFIPEHFY